MSNKIRFYRLEHRIDEYGVESDSDEEKETPHPEPVKKQPKIVLQRALPDKAGS